MYFQEPQSSAIYFSKEDKELLENYCTFFNRFCILIGHYHFTCSKTGCPAYDFCPKKYNGKESEYQDILTYIIKWFEDFCNDNEIDVFFEE